MDDSAVNNASPGHDREEQDAQARELCELRELLTGPERRRLDDILLRLNDPVRRAEELSETLPDAITLSRARDKRLANALGPSIDTALKASVRKDPKPIADAIFPALGPAIRKAISTTLMGMIQSLNQLLNQSFSFQGLRWRLEALRTRRPFAEVVLLHTLVYQVEQIFLIHRHTGVVLQHVAAADALVRDPDLVSGMLTAIQEFVKDAFDSRSDETLDTLRMGGDHSVWIEQGSEAFLAVVLRGTPPLHLREDFRDLLAEIHRTFQAKLEDFDGQIASFAMVQPQLENALTAEVRSPRLRISPLLWLGALVLISLGVFWGWRLQEQRRQWHDFLAQLQAQSGIVVTAARKESGRFHIEGLRDPLALVPQQLYAAAGIDPQQVESNWEPYQSLDPVIVLQRAERLLRPPAGVDVQLRGGILIVSGQADHDWVTQLHHLAAALPGVETIDSHALQDIQLEELQSLAARLSRQTIGFELGSDEPAAKQEDRMLAISSILSAMSGLRQQSAIEVRVFILGQSDPTGPELLNMELSRNRSLRVMRFLIEKGIDPAMLAAVGKGSRVQPLPADARQDFADERRVTFRTFIGGREAGL